MVGEVQSALAEADNPETVFVSHDVMLEFPRCTNSMMSNYILLG